jgi:uncharacterized protein YwqG
MPSSRTDGPFWKRLFGRAPAAPADLSRHREVLDALRKPAVHLLASSERGFSRLGGAPTLPAGFEWPTWKGRPLSFLCQLDLSAASATATAGGLPPSGSIHVFYDPEQSTWGFDPKDRGSWRVYYFDRLENAVVVPAPASPSAEAYTEVPLTFRPVLTYPDWQDDRVAALNMSDAESDVYAELCEGVFDGAPRHYLLGHPSPVQDNDMDLQCQLVTHGLYCGDSSGYQAPERPALEPGRRDWIQLLQLDSDDRANMMWGDGGSLYFWITKTALARRDFSNVWMVLQCH